MVERPHRGAATWSLLALTAVLTLLPLVSVTRSLLFSLVGLGESAPNAELGLLAGALLLAAAALAVSPPVCADFDRKRIADEVRERRRREQQRRSSAPTTTRRTP